MCYTISVPKTDKALQVRYNKKMDDLVKSRQTALYLNGFGLPRLAIIKQEDPETITTAKWGLVPSFIKDAVKAKEYAEYTLNAQGEKIFETKSYKNSIMPRRCLIPVSGFYEWMDLNKVKYPHFIYLKEEEIFSLGGVYDSWINQETGDITSTVSIITTEANPLMARIHNLKKRMPLIFTRETEQGWLNNSLSETEVKSFIRPLNEDLMNAHTIKKISPKNVDPFSEEIIKPFEYPELQLI